MSFTLQRVVPLPPHEAFARLLDVTAHADGIPLTVMTTDPGEPAPGWRFVARTRLGPAYFDDPMVITELDPGRRVRIVKTGRVLSGWAEISVADHPRGSLVTWTEEVVPAVPLLARVVRWWSDRLASKVFDRALDRVFPQ